MPSIGLLASNPTRAKHQPLRTSVAKAEATHHFDVTNNIVSPNNRTAGSSMGNDVSSIHVVGVRSMLGLDWENGENAALGDFCP